MQWLPPMFRLVYSRDRINSELFNQLNNYLSQASLFCSLDNKMVGLVTKMDKQDDGRVLFTLYELSVGDLAGVNSEQYHIEVELQQNYIKDSDISVSNILRLKHEEV